MKKLTNEEFITKCIKSHGNIFDYSKTEYINTRTKIKIICKNHGIFEMTPDNHINQKQGCVLCARETHKLTILTNERIQKFKNIHDNKYFYEDLNIKNGYINIICPIHGIFKQSIHNHGYGHGCLECVSSKGENKIKNILENKKLRYKKNYEFSGCKRTRKLRFDFYLLDKNICIEYDGEHHFAENEYFGKGNLEYIKVNDEIKNEYCKDNKIKLIRIPYWDYSIIENYLQDINI